jgi:CDGSH-type Zn-finger protein
MPKVTVHANENGPNVVLVDGKFVLELCRCGHSSEKPFCDGTHRRVDFKAPKAEVVLPE